MRRANNKISPERGGGRIKQVALTIALLMWADATLADYSEGRTRVANTIATGVGAVIAGMINGKVDGFHSAGRMFAAGAAAGLVFYESKEWMGRGEIPEALIASQTASSVLENVTWGRGPFESLRYSIGPVSVRHTFRESAQLDRGTRLEVDAFYVPQHLALLADGGKWILEDGLLITSGKSAPGGFLASSQSESDAHAGLAFGRALWVQSGLSAADHQRIVRHEGIHYIQSYQIDTVLDGAQLMGWKSKRILGIPVAVRLTLLDILEQIHQDTYDYSDDWYEIEAHGIMSTDHILASH